MVYLALDCGLGEKKDVVKFLRFTVQKITYCGMLLFISSSVFALNTDISGLDLVGGLPIQVKLEQAPLATVLVFLSIKCPCSLSHHPSLNLLAEKFTSLGFQFVGIHSNANENLKSSLEFFKFSKLVFPVVQDAQAELANRYDAFKTPHVFIVSPTRQVLFSGGVDNTKISQKPTQFYLRDALIAIQEGKQPAQNNVRVLGCEIQRP